MDHHISCVAKVLKQLADNPRVPGSPRDVCSICIDLGDLAGAIIDTGFIDAVWHFPSEPNSVGLEGMFVKRKFDNGKKTAAAIFYDKRLSAPEATFEQRAKRRFIVAKEVSGVFDRAGEQTATAPEIRDLVSGMISKSTGVNDSKQIRADYNGVLLAIELIIPFERRKAIIAQGPITSAVVEKLAQDCCFPAQYVRIALDSRYMNIIDRLRQKAKVKDLI
jgi:hypothetical protein